jgi:hypothetical protein
MTATFCPCKCGRIIYAHAHCAKCGEVFCYGTKRDQESRLCVDCQRKASKTKKRKATK